MKIAIASGKGGTGKTTIAVNLASMISIRKSEQKVVLADMDVEEPNTGLFLDDEPYYSEVIVRDVPFWDRMNCSFCGQCKLLCNFNAIVILPEQLLIYPELCHSCQACIELCPNQALAITKRKIGTLIHRKTTMLDIIESRLDIGEPSGVSLIKQTKGYLKNRFNSHELFILDCPPGNSCPVIESVKDSDFVILVTEPTPFGLNDMKIAINTMRKLKLNFGVVINKEGIGNDEVKTYCKHNNINIIGNIPYNRAFTELSANGGLLHSQFSDFKNELKSIYRNLQRIHKELIKI